MADRDQSLLTLPYMVRWFSPTLLANAAVRAMVSPVFGTFADARAVHANVDGFEPHKLEEVAQRYDLSELGIADALGVVWVDYLADTGDGFDSTYAMASLVAQDWYHSARCRPSTRSSPTRTPAPGTCWPRWSCRAARVGVPWPLRARR